LEFFLRMSKNDLTNEQINHILLEANKIPCVNILPPRLVKIFEIEG